MINLGVVFDRNMAGAYNTWLYSREGRLFNQTVKKALNEIPIRHGDKILEVGCGMGNHLELFNIKGFDLYGIEASGYMIDRARERLGSRFTLKKGQAEDLPFEDNQFDLVMFINTLEFVDDFKKAIAEAGRVARSWLIICFLNSLSWFYISHKLRGIFGKSIFSNAKFFNLWELKAYLRDILGDVETRWYCSMSWSTMLQRVGERHQLIKGLPPCPFGSFIGLKVTLVYKMRAQGLPLTMGFKDAPEPMIGG